ncbi:MAG TPA: cupredoxin domain-containing protein [Candidatus Limnocylindrales bacterium]|nr:cupredoxin domain-containing protein [Candidatus Limnocylindrales bacterium]
MKRLFTTLGLAALAVIAVACSGAAAQPPASAGPVDPNAPVVVAQGNAFSPATVTIKADKAFNLTLDNKDSAPHNVAIFKDASAAEAVSIGEIVSSSKATQQVPALAKGEYFFRCDVHKEMTGKVVAE